MKDTLHDMLVLPKYYKHIFYHLFQYNWTTYIQSMVYLAEDNVTINETEPVILVAPKYYKHIFEILENEDKR